VAGKSALAMWEGQLCAGTTSNTRMDPVKPDWLGSLHQVGKVFALYSPVRRAGLFADFYRDPSCRVWHIRYGSVGSRVIPNRVVISFAGISV
jgi:hypothetical protein